MTTTGRSPSDIEIPTVSWPSTRPQELRIRLLTSLVLMPLFVVALVLGHVLFLGAALLLAGVGTWEFLNLAALKGFRVRSVAGVGFALALPIVLYWGAAPGFELTMLIAAGAIGIAVTQLFSDGDDQAIAAVSVTVFAAIYVGLLFGHFVLVREIAREIPGAPYWTGAALLTVPLVLTWINDTAAYAIGHRWGHRKLMPTVSPGKSVEGAVGALAVTVVVAFPVLWIVDRWVPLFTAVDALALGALIGVAAPCGDLVESTFKRDAGVKDVSRLIPGHGGVLDRFDSLLLTVPVFYYYFKAVVL